MRITESQLREIISSTIKEYLCERGTNLSSLYHFTDMWGLCGIIQSGLFNLSPFQPEIRSGKNFISFTRHKSPLEGYAAMNKCFVRIEVFPKTLNSLHDKSIDSFEYYSPDNAKIYRRNTSYNNGDSAKAAYIQKHKEKAMYSEYFNQAEESLTSDKHYINAERVIKRIDICTATLKECCDSYEDIEDLYEIFAKILNADYSSLYDKIFIYDNLRDFSLQTNNCVPIAEYSIEDLRVALGLDNISQKPVAEGISEEGIHIKEKNKGKFTATKKRTGKSTEELTHSKNPLTRKRAIFAQNVKKWSKGK